MNRDQNLIDQETPRQTAQRRTAAAFTEWERRYRETPAQFMSDFEKASLGLTDYGAKAAAYFLALTDELFQVPDGSNVTST